METKLTSQTLLKDSYDIVDINDIQVCIPNEHLPIIIPYGSLGCGKTMMIIRLCKYLIRRGYHIKPVRDFRTISDKHYKGTCERFEKFLYTEETFPSTTPYGFILIEVFDKGGQPICYLFDAEGNCYFNKGYPNASYPAFISHVICSPNPKQYIFFVEPNWEDVQIRHNYVSHIATFRTHFNPKDNAIILYNKIDKCPLYITPTGYVDIRIAAKDCQNQYAGLFDIFRRRIPILRWFYPYIFTFIPFSSGFFYQDVSGTYKYEASIDLYPQKLWKEIMKAVRR